MDTASRLPTAATSSGALYKRRFTLTWIVAHMIEQTARHNGHADILREQIDGTTGE